MSSHSKEDPLDTIVFNKDVIEFTAVAVQFCTFLEDISEISKREFLEKSQKFLSLLYLKALMLLGDEREEDAESQKFVSESDWNYIQTSIADKLGDTEVFVDIFEPDDLTETINISLSEAFSDIYQDLKDYSELYKMGNIEASRGGVWECRHHFENHFGPRILLILSEIHNILFSGEDFENESLEKSELNLPKNNDNQWVNHLFN